jgi:hypothetical protein
MQQVSEADIDIERLELGLEVGFGGTVVLGDSVFQL